MPDKIAKSSNLFLVWLKILSLTFLLSLFTLLLLVNWPLSITKLQTGCATGAFCNLTFVIDYPTLFFNFLLRLAVLLPLFWFLETKHYLTRRNLLFGTLTFSVAVLLLFIWVALPRSEPNFAYPTTTKTASISGAQQTTPDPTSNWKTYSDGSISFKYPGTWDQYPIQLVGSGSSVEIDDTQGVFVLNFIQRGNYNNGTEKPYADLYEYIDMHQVAEINVGGQKAVEPLPRAGSEDIYLADFFSRDKKLIYSFHLEPKSRTSDRQKPENEEKIFNQILSTFKFL